MAARAVPVVAVAPASAPTASTAAAPIRANAFGREVRERSHERTDACSGSFPGLPRRRNAASSRGTPPCPNSTWRLVRVVPIRTPYRAGGTLAGSVLVALTNAEALEGAVLSVGLQRGFGGDGAPDSAGLSRGWTSFVRRACGIGSIADLPRTPLTGPLKQLGRDRGDAAVRPPVRVARPVARAEPAVGARLLGRPSATRLSRNATVEPRWTKGQRAPNPATHRPSTFAWAPPSRRGPPLTPPTAGRTIPSKRLRGTDSIPAFLRCGRLGRGDADGGEGVGRAGRDGPGSSGQPLPSQEP